ncbi:WXG100 family type VII secretion target [Micromonospora sp. CA-249363]|uniref:WXG100 family type VII secretion target n=1 Tax=Micromonospora sp. CA-249363 TaxID=3239963 RepID=UPI003D8B6E65
MAQPIGITFQMLQEGNKACLQTVTDVSGELASMRSYVSDLAAQWLGASSKQYQNLMNDFDRYGQMLNDSLTGIADGLQGNFHNYTTTEAAVESQFKDVNEALPQANLN